MNLPFWFMIALTAVLTYLVGSVSFGYLVSRSHGVNILKVGSGNPGFTNVLRTQGMHVALLVLAGDMLKGTFASFLGAHLAGEPGMLVGVVMVIVGHSFSPMLHFKGGKGIATGAGAMLYVSPLAMLLCTVTVLLLAYLTKYMSVGSIVAALACPAYLWLDHQSALVIAVFACCAVYVVWLHRANIVRLVHGKENKLSFHK